MSNIKKNSTLNLNYTCKQQRITKMTHRKFCGLHFQTLRCGGGWEGGLLRLLALVCTNCPPGTPSNMLWRKLADVMIIQVDLTKLHETFKCEPRGQTCRGSEICSMRGIWHTSSSSLAWRQKGPQHKEGRQPRRDKWPPSIDSKICIRSPFLLPQGAEFCQQPTCSWQ